MPKPLFSDRRLITGFSIIVVFCATAAVAMAAEGEIQRTSYGKPDLSGTYDGATLTPLVRPKEYGDKLYLTPEEAEEIAEAERKAMAESNKVSDPDRDAPPEGGDGSVGASGNVGGYNSFWIDRGEEAFLVDGKFRTSILIEPADGQMPAMTPAARAARAKRFAGFQLSNDGTAYWIDKGDEPGPYDNMEQRPHAERCLLGFSGATPSFPSLYNNFKRIVQTEDHVMILIEMNHDARVVRMNSEHKPKEIQTWLGDSIGWWEGDTLVVDSTNFLPGTQGRGGTESLHVVERFTKQPDGHVLYRFTVEDPAVWEEPWTGEYIWHQSDDKVYEYACHEGNHALGGIMRGARILEKDAIEKAKADNSP
jgi:hypothetical protein